MRYIISLILASLLALPARGDVPRVVTDLPPVGALVAQVMGELGAPVVLLERGADAHAFQLRPSQAQDIAAADAVIWIGPEMTPWLDRALAGARDDVADVRLLSVPGTHLQPFADGAWDVSHDHGHGHDARGPDAHSHSDGTAPATAAETESTANHDATGTHDHDGIDPHAWLDPANAEVWLAEIARVLGAHDPAHAATYAANAAAAQAAVRQLDGDLQALLAPARGQPLVMFHAAYGYLAGHYALNIVGAISDGDAASPGAAHLRSLQATMANTPVCLFPETNHDPSLLASLSEAGGVRLGASLDPEGATLAQGPDLYAALMRGLATAIADCAGAVTP